MRQRNDWDVPASSYAKNTFNPIRNIVENLKIVPHPDKPMIALSIGDPTIFGNLKPAGEVTEAVVDAIRSGKANGYAPSTGYVPAREAVAKYCSSPEYPLEAKDIILCSGCSCALDICITAMCNPGQNILVPRPGFPLYETLAVGLGIEVKHYDLSPQRNWEVDLDMLEDEIDEKTAAIVVNNPSNPCGSVFSKEHLLDILTIAKRNKVPIIADEIYNDFVFEGQEFHYMANLSPDVPVLSCGGLTKRFLVPGWRMGWIVISDRGGILAKEVRNGLNSLSQRIIGSNTLIQAALPTILEKTPKIFFEDTLSQVEDNAMLCYDYLRRTPGLKPIMPQGAMYMMVGISIENFPEFRTDLELVERMICEESVFCLPGKCFSLPNYFRVVLTVPKEQMTEACERILAFCQAHFVPSHHLIAKQVLVNGEQTTNGHMKSNGVYNGDRFESIPKIPKTDGNRAPMGEDDSNENQMGNGNHRKTGMINGQSHGKSKIEIPDPEDLIVEVKKMKLRASLLKGHVCNSIDQERD